VTGVSVTLMVLLGLGLVAVGVTSLAATRPDGARH
jgi:hypothetical protein